jgi:hypothetical protein
LGRESCIFGRQQGDERIGKKGGFAKDRRVFLAFFFSAVETRAEADLTIAEALDPDDDDGTDLVCGRSILIGPVQATSRHPSFFGTNVRETVETRKKAPLA